MGNSLLITAQTQLYEPQGMRYSVDRAKGAALLTTPFHRRFFASSSAASALSRSPRSSSASNQSFRLLEKRRKNSGFIVLNNAVARPMASPITVLAANP